MAAFTAIKNATQSGGALGRALDYVKQEKKVRWGDRQLVSGWNCVAQSAYDEMMTTKQRYGKTDGRAFYQFVQSFSPVEDVTPEEVHAIGLELAAKLFPGYEVVVATHVDADHLHNHLIVNSVSCETGRKLHQNAADLQRQRQISDEICMAHGLTVLPPQLHKRSDNLSAREYRSAVKGQSWKFQLMATIDFCMRRAKRKENFIREMERRGIRCGGSPVASSSPTPRPRERSAGMTGCTEKNIGRRSWSVSSEFEKRLSNEELKRRNSPPEVEMPSASEVPQTPAPTCPTEEQWRQLLALQVQTVKLLERTTERVEDYPTPPSLYPVTERLTGMEKELSAVRQTVEKNEQAGRKNGRRLSLPKLRLPQLPRPNRNWLWAIPVTVALLVTLYALAIGWNNLLKPFLLLIRP